MDLGRRGEIGGNSDRKGGGSERSRGDRLILVCVLKRKTPEGISVVLADAEPTYQSIRSHPRPAAREVRGCPHLGH
jgi:hypothetical protein